MIARSRAADVGVVCLHGLGRSPSDWAGVTPGLAAFGTVAAPALPRDPADALRHAATVLQAGDVVVGHSLGALTALRLAADASRPLRAVVLTGCFFPPARNGRGVAETARDYAGHRVSYVRGLSNQPRAGGTRAGTAGALLSLIGLAVRRGEFEATLAAVRAPVLVLHARDDHHVPVNFALAAAGRHPEWELCVLQHGGHHAHVDRPADWLAVVAPWLREL